MGYRVVTSEEKAEAIRLVVEMHYSVPKACEATGVGPTALRRWVFTLASGAGRNIAASTTAGSGADRVATGKTGAT
ncbi:transposase [Pseudomonas lini]